MAFFKRLGWYLMGMSIGIVFLVFFLKKKSGGNDIGFCYLPNCRVLKDIRAKSFLTTEGETLTFEELKPEIQLALTDGDINFSKSETKQSPCKRYHIESNESEKVAFLKVKNCPEKVVIESVKFR